jgi:tetrahydromethanopterin S-methyltransferase subunit E
MHDRVDGERQFQRHDFAGKLAVASDGDFVLTRYCSGDVTP